MFEYWSSYFAQMSADLRAWVETGDLPPGSPLGALASASLGLSAAGSHVLGGGH